MRKLFFISLLLCIFGSLLFAFNSPALARCGPKCVNPQRCDYPDCYSCPWCDGTQAGAPEIFNPALIETIREYTGIQFLNLFLPNLITLFFIGATIAAFFVLLAGGIKWITSGGDKEGTAKAQGIITAGIVGLLLVFSVYAIIRLIEFFFGISLITIDIGPLILE